MAEWWETKPGDPAPPSAAAPLPSAPARDVGAALGATPLPPETLRILGEINARPQAAAAPPIAQPDVAPPSAAPDADWWATKPSATAAIPAGAPGDPLVAVGRAPFMNRAADTASFGLGGGLAALGEAASGKLIDLVSPGSYPSSFWDQYREARQRQGQQAQQYQAQAPLAATAANVVGGLASGLPAARLLGAAAPAVASPLIAQLARGGALGAAGGAAQAYGTAGPDTPWVPNSETLPGILAGAGAGALGGVATAAPGIVPAAKQAGMTLSELGERAYKAGMGFASGEFAGHPLIGAMLGLPGALKSAKELGSAMMQKVPEYFLPYAPGMGAATGSAMAQGY